MERIALGMAVAGLMISAGCGKSGDRSSLTPAEELDAVLRPTALAGAFRRLPGGHFTGTVTFRVAPTGTKSDDDAITTKSEL